MAVSVELYRHSSEPPVTVHSGLPGEFSARLIDGMVGLQEEYYQRVAPFTLDFDEFLAAQMESFDDIEVGIDHTGDTDQRRRRPMVSMAVQSVTEAKENPVLAFAITGDNASADYPNFQFHGRNIPLPRFVQKVGRRAEIEAKLRLPLDTFIDGRYVWIKELIGKPGFEGTAMAMTCLYRNLQLNHDIRQPVSCWPGKRELWLMMQMANLGMSGTRTTKLWEPRGLNTTMELEMYKGRSVGYVMGDLALHYPEVPQLLTGLSE